VAGQHRQERVHRHRLGDEAQHPQTVGVRHRLHLALGLLVGAARDHNRGAEALVADLLQELDAVHLRHQQVAHDHVDRLLLFPEGLERRPAVGGPEQGTDAGAGQEPGEELALQVVVIHDEDAERAVLEAAVNPSVQEPRPLYERRAARGSICH
jgi:hypothetical protein